MTGEYPDAVRDLQEALGICRDLGDRPGQASALTFLGAGEWLTGDYPAAARDLQEALGICRDLGDRPGQVNALTWLGVVRRLTGDYPGAARDLQEAAGISRDLGYLGGEFTALIHLGEVRRLTGDYPGATRDLQEAAAPVNAANATSGPAPSATSESCGGSPAISQRRPGTCRRRWVPSGTTGDRLGVAEALTHLGAVRRITGDYPGAARDLQEALDIARRDRQPGR